MIRLTERANEILEAAESAARRGMSCSEWTLLVTSEGAIRMIADSDRPLDSLAGGHGPQAAYRIIDDRRGAARRGAVGLAKLHHPIDDAPPGRAPVARFISQSSRRTFTGGLAPNII